MKEFKFLAMRCSFQKIALINIPISIAVALFVAIRYILGYNALDIIEAYFFYIWIVLFTSLATLFAIMFRYVKITCYPNGDITFSYFGRVVYASTINQLEWSG